MLKILSEMLQEFSEKFNKKRNILVQKLKLEQLGRIDVESFKKAEKTPLIVVLDNVRSMHNVGAIFRTADAFLIEKIVLCGITPQPPHREIHKAALGATESVDWVYFEKIEEALNLIKNMQDKENIGVLGLHIEGPYISLEKKGIHRPEYVRVLSDEIIDKISDAGYDVTKIMTIAPEKGKVEHLKKLRQSGIKLNMGHTNANYDECVEKKEYFDGATHLYNAMSQLQSRNPGAVGFVMNDDKVMAGIIVDGYHMTFSAVEIAKKIMKDRLYLVTDAVSPAGIDTMTEFMFEGNRVFYKDKKCQSAEGTLGGSALVMIEGIENLVKKVHLTIEEALKMATSLPAKAISVEDRYGYIKEGYVADLTFFNEDYKVKGTVAKGQLNLY